MPFPSATKQPQLHQTAWTGSYLKRPHTKKNTKKSYAETLEVGVFDKRIPMPCKPTQVSSKTESTTSARLSRLFRQMTPTWTSRVMGAHIPDSGTTSVIGGRYISRVTRIRNSPSAHPHVDVACTTTLQPTDASTAARQ